MSYLFHISESPLTGHDLAQLAEDGKTSLMPKDIQELLTVVESVLSHPQFYGALQCYIASDSEDDNFRVVRIIPSSAKPTKAPFFIEMFLFQKSIVLYHPRQECRLLLYLDYLLITRIMAVTRSNVEQYQINVAALPTTLQECYSPKFYADKVHDCRLLFMYSEFSPFLV